MLDKEWRIAVVVVWLLPASLSSLPRFAKPGPSSRSDSKVGMSFRTFTPDEPYNWRGAKTHALGATVWYPAAASAVEQPIEIPGMSELFVIGRAARDVNLASTPVKYPLVVLSHGTGGSALQMAWLGTSLAANGYIAVAVNHPGNNATETYTAQGFSTWWERARDLSVVIDSMLADPTFGSRIDSHRIGAAGFSLAPSGNSVLRTRQTLYARARRNFRPWSTISTSYRPPTPRFKLRWPMRAIPIATSGFGPYLPLRPRSDLHFAPRACRQSPFR
jgi:hypothetical protein